MVIKLKVVPLGQGRPKRPENECQRVDRHHPDRLGLQRYDQDKRGTWRHLS